MKSRQLAYEFPTARELGLEVLRGRLRLGEVDVGFGFVAGIMAYMGFA